MDQSEQQKNISSELSPVLDIVAEAFESEGESALERVYIFDPLQHEDSTWGFVIVTRRSADSRLELAAFSYEVDDQGAVSRRLESRRAMIPAEKLQDVVEGIVLRLDEPDCTYREIDLSGHGSRAEQVRHLDRLLRGEDHAGDHEQG